MLVGEVGRGVGEGGLRRGDEEGSRHEVVRVLGVDAVGLRREEVLVDREVEALAVVVAVEAEAGVVALAVVEVRREVKRSSKRTIGVYGIHRLDIMRYFGGGVIMTFIWYLRTRPEHLKESGLMIDRSVYQYISSSLRSFLHAIDVALTDNLASINHLL